MEPDLNELVGLLDAAVEAAEEATARPKQKKARTVATAAEDVEDGDEIIARLLAREQASRPAPDTEPEAEADSFGSEPEPRRPSPAAPSAAGPDLLEIKEKQLREVLERFARLQSDFESYKKRTDREREESKKFANEQLLLQILPIVDSFERALSHARQQRDPRAFEDGILLIYKQFHDVLCNIGLQPVESVGQKFDPRFHEAVVQIEDPTVEPNTVISEYQKGYLLNERLLRPARVIVAKGGAAAEGMLTPAAGREED